MKEGSICNKCNHRAYCAMGDEHNNDNATIKGCYLYSEQKGKTNADRIRSMSDEELAGLLTFIKHHADHLMVHKLARIGLSGLTLVEFKYETYFSFLLFLKNTNSN